MRSSEILGALTLISAAVIFFLVFYETDDEARKLQPQPEKEPVQQTQADFKVPPDLSALIKAKEKAQQKGEQEKAGQQESDAAKDADAEDAQKQDNEEKPEAAKESGDSEEKSEEGDDKAVSQSAEADDTSQQASSSAESSSQNSDDEKEAEDPGSEAEKRSSGGATHTVSKGETLCGISRQYFGDASRWKKILAANSNLLDEPENLRVGMKLRIPGASEKRSEEKATKKQKKSKSSSSSPAPKAQKSSSGPFLLSGVAREKLYEVEKGDTLYGIAEDIYDDGSQWKRLLKANSDRLDSANDLRVGMKLVVPAEE